MKDRLRDVVNGYNFNHDPASIKGMKKKPPEEKMTTANEKQTTLRLGNYEIIWSDLLRDAVIFQPGSRKDQDVQNALSMRLREVKAQ